MWFWIVGGSLERGLRRYVRRLLSLSYPCKDCIVLASILLEGKYNRRCLGRSLFECRTSGLTAVFYWIYGDVGVMLLARLQLGDHMVDKTGTGGLVEVKYTVDPCSLE